MLGSCLFRLSLPVFAWRIISTLAELTLSCDKDSLPSAFSNDPLKPSLVCGPSACLARANVTCESSLKPCTARHHWLRSVTFSDSSPPLYTCCRSPQVLRSSLQRTVPVLPQHSAFMRGFEVAAAFTNPNGQSEDALFQFGEIITLLRFDKNGAAVMEVARFKCGRAIDPEPLAYDYADYGSYLKRRKRNSGLIEPLDKPACDSEWPTEEIGSLGGQREGRGGPGFQPISRVTDLSFCGVEVRPSSQAFLTF